MSSQNNVDFILEIIKARTTTRQAEPDDAAPPLSTSFCCGSHPVVFSCDTEVREQAPKPSPPRQSTASSSPTPSSAFDYYGNPIGEPLEVREQAPKPSPPRQSTASSSTMPSSAFDYYGNPIGEPPEVREQAPKPSPPLQSTASSSPLPSSAFDYYGNPIGAPQQRSYVEQLTPQPAPSQSVKFARYARREDFSEFLELNPIPTPTAEVQPKGEDVERGCVAEFGQCMKVSLCCDADESFENDEGGMTQEEMMKELNDELQALRKSTRESKESKAVLQCELRAELASVRQENIKMEESYRREMAREAVEKMCLQAKLQQKLLRMMEERMRVEIQLGQLDCVSNRSGSSTETRDMIPTAQCTPMSQEHERSSPLSAGGAKRVPSLSPHETVDPPAESLPVSSTLLTSTPRSKTLKTTPFGLSIVVENMASGGGCEPEGSVGGGSELASPTMNRSPPSSPCDPEGSMGDINSPTANRSPSCNSLPLPVATPVEQFRAANGSFEVSE